MFTKVTFLAAIFSLNNAQSNAFDRWITAGEYPGMGLSIEEVAELQASTGSESLVKDSDPIGCVLMGKSKLYLESNRFGPSGTSIYFVMNGDKAFNCTEKKLNVVFLNKLISEIDRSKLIPSKKTEIFTQSGIETFKNSEFSCFDKEGTHERGQTSLLRGIKACKFRGAISGYLVILTEGI